MNPASENSDDEMDLLGPSCQLYDATSTSRLVPEPEKTDDEIEDEEVLTSDPDELAEVIANRSLEKYSDRISNTLSPGNMRTEPDKEKNSGVFRSVSNLSTTRTPMKRNNFRSRPLLPSSSPTRLTQTSGDNYASTEEHAMSEDHPETSSPDGSLSRYSPPAHLRPRLVEPTTKFSPSREDRNTDSHEMDYLSQNSDVGLDARDTYDVASHTNSAMSIANSPLIDPVASSDEIAELLQESPPRLPISGPPTNDLNSISSPVISQTCRDPLSPVPNHSKAMAARPSTSFHPPSPSLSLPRGAPNNSVTPSPEPIFDIPQGRTLRARTARQQHPYALEYAQYKNSMRRAGLDDAIVRLQAIEREKALKEHGQVKQVQPEMDGFIVPEDEESQDLYVPPTTPPPRVQRNETAGPAAPDIDMEALLAGFGGMISDDETPVERRDRKGNGKESNPAVSTKARVAPRPFPLGTTKRVQAHAVSSKPPPTESVPSASSIRQTLPSTPASSPPPTRHRRQTSFLSSQRSRKSPTKESNPPNSSSSESKSEPESASDSDDSSSGSLAAAERKRFRILRRMMPAAWVRRQMEEEARKREAKTANRKRPDSPLRPGQARTRTRIRGSDDPLVLHGDSESENDGPLPSRNSGLPRPPTPTSPPNPNLIRPRVFPPKRLTQIPDDSSGDDIIDIQSSDGRSSVVEITTPAVNDEEISTWLAYRSPKRTAGDRQSGGGGGDLINRMLSRTNGPARDVRTGSGKVRTGYDRGGHKLKQAKLTSMFRASSPGDQVLELSSSDDGARAGASQAPITRKSKKPRSTGTRAARTSRATRNSKSGRTLTIQGDLAELLDATILPGPQRDSSKSKASTHNRAVSNGLHIREGHGLPRSQPGVSSPPRRAARPDNFGHRTVSTDSGVVPFKPHTKFSPSSYLGRGYMQNLINVATAAETSPIEAAPVIVFGEHLDTRLTGTEFVDQVRRLVPHWTAWLAGRHDESNNNVIRSFRFIALRLTFLLESRNEEASEASLDIESESRAFLEEDAREIYKITSTVSSADPAIKDDSSASTSPWLLFHWFIVELAVRIACGNRRRALRVSATAALASTDLDSAIQRMIFSLLGHNLAENIREAYESDGDLDDPVLEIWVCLIHLVDETDLAGVVTWKPLWSRVESVLDSPAFVLPYKVYESERRWEYIFGFSALEAISSQTGRLLSFRPPISRWAWVCKTIKDIRLKEDKVIEEAKQTRQRVDYYVRVITARCWLLHTMWGWSYSQSDRLLNLLYPVFQTRKLSRLRDERTDFPAFIRNLDLGHLERFSNGDTAWSMFLKIFRMTIIDSPTSARKLYSAYAPVAVLNFTNDNPATDMDLSRLFNSFSMFLVILITDPTSERGADCVRRVQGLMSFKAADMRSREACIRAFQYMGLLFKHYQLEMEPLVSWMHLMLQSLREEMRESIVQAQRNRLVVLALCLVRSVAAITSTSGFDQDSKKEYPEVILLTEDFVQTMFQLDLKNNKAARRETKQFLEAFCHARDAFLATLPPKPVPEVAMEEESQESYGFDEFDLDLDNPEVLAGLDAFEGDLPAPVNLDPIVAKERRAAEIFNKIVSPAVFENIILGFGLDDRRLPSSPERGCDAEESAWIRVWFGCVKVVVENRQRSWRDYLNDWGNAKDERISRIIDISAERRVRIYFCYLALKHTSALLQRGSKEQKQLFLIPWFQCLPHPRYTVEHKYTALICQLGMKSDPLLEGLPCRTNEKGEYYVLNSELMAERGDYVRCILKNLHNLSQSHYESSSAATLARSRTCVAKLFETMKQTWDLLGRSYAPSADKELIPSYLDFCHSVRSSATEFLTTPPIQDLSSRLNWVPPL